MDSYSERHVLDDKRWDGINRRIDALLKRFLGDFEWKGPRNWFGSVKEGSWSQTTGDSHKILVPYAFLFILLPLLWYVVVTNWAMQASALLLITLLFAILYYVQNIKPQLPLEFMSHGNWRDFPKYIKQGVSVGTVWIVIYLVLGNVTIQSIIMPGTPLGFLFELYNSLNIIPWVEESFFCALILASVATVLGVIPAIIIAAGARSLFHVAILEANALDMFMAFLFGLMVYPFALKEKVKDNAIAMHIYVTVITIILNLIILSPQ